MQDFTGKVALITGAGSRLGREVALGFSSLGASVAAVDINPLGVDETAASILKAGGNARSYVFDTAKRMPVEGLVAQVLEQFGRIDILVNQAAVLRDAALLEMDEWEFHRTLDVNLGGAFFAIQQVGRVMQQQGGGVMVNVVSAADDRSIRKGHTAFTASQAGLIGLTRAAAHELAGSNIRVNAVYNGRLDIIQVPAQGWDEAIFDRWLESVPDLCKGEYQSLVCRLLFLCSDSALSLNGLVIECGSPV